MAQVKAGRCVICGEKRAHYKQHCDACQDKHRELKRRLTGCKPYSGGRGRPPKRQSQWDDVSAIDHAALFPPAITGADIAISLIDGIVRMPHKTKAPETLSSTGRFAEQPSPKRCSIQT